MKIKNLLLLTATALLLTACGSTKEVPYLIDASSLTQSALNNAARNIDQPLAPGDLIQINVSCTQPELVKMFNKTELIGNTSNLNNSSNENSIYYYLVDSKGNIDFPVLGRLHVGGMTISATSDYITSQIYPKYITERPVVEVRLQNFNVYVLGEVKQPGRIKAPNGRLNILEALSMAGDLTIQGRRDNIMIVHNNSDGTREVRRVNLNDANLLVSSDLYLRQNDIVYVEPNASKARSSWQVPPGLTLAFSSLGVALSIATLVVTLTK
ncbi:MAG: polysaccharide biosynthesis/export family protein [Muribaculaceae bacterium]|nr:polysaccharide biosynthesis/export family protein [Muribaculaceae bacterium]